MTNLREVAAFLLGEGELDGVGFGDPHPTERGNYWWRKHLRAALAQPEPEELGEIVPANEEQLKRIAKLVEPEPEPVAWYYAGSDVEWHSIALDADLDDAQKANCTPLYTAPPQREWQGLTDEELDQAMDYWSDPSRSAYGGAHGANGEYVDMIDTWRHIEAKLKEKNT